MKVYYPPIIAFGLLALTIGNAHASATEENNIKMHCAIFKNDKLVKQQKCVADGYVFSNVYNTGAGYTFKPIQNYGKLEVHIANEAVVDANDNPIVDANGFMDIKTSYEMNGKDATIRYRMAKTFKLLTKAQKQQYENGTLKTQPYTCLTYKKKPTFEFCFSKPFMG